MDTDEYFNNGVISKLIDMYTRILSKHVYNSIPYPHLMSKEDMGDIKRDMLVMGLEFCSKNKNKFNTQNGTKPEAYFGTILRSFVITKCLNIRNDPEYKRSYRERKINEILGEPNQEYPIYNI